MFLRKAGDLELWLPSGEGLTSPGLGAFHSLTGTDHGWSGLGMARRLVQTGSQRSAASSPGWALSLVQWEKQLLITCLSAVWGASGPLWGPGPNSYLMVQQRGLVGVGAAGAGALPGCLGPLQWAPCVGALDAASSPRLGVQGQGRQQHVVW